MSNKNFSGKTGLLILFIMFFSLSIAADNIFAASTQLHIEITSPAPVCGNGTLESGEQCDGSQLGGQTCASRGYSSGALSCGSNCSFNTSNCVSGGGGGGGGGGGSYTPPAPITAVIFSGRAYPKSEVTLLKDAQVAVTTVAGADANFSINLSGLAGGSYIFSLYGEDNGGNRSSLLTFPVSVTSGATTTVSGIFIAPTISVDKSEIKRGDHVAIFGQSAPMAEIIISVGSEEEIFAKTTSDKGGVYLYNFDTSVLDYGSHIAKSKAAVAGQLISGFSNAVSFKIGDKTAEKEEAKETGNAKKSDVNNDGRVNLVDFSITAYWYKRLSPPASSDLNGDGKVDLVDFSIMAYYWTG